MNLIKTSLLSGLSTAIRMVSGIVVTKIGAVYIGPSGVALIGQLQNIVNMISTLATGGTQQGVTKYIAEYREEPDKQKEILATSIKISLTISIILGILLILFSNYLSSIILKQEEYSIVFVLFGMTIVMYSLNTIFLAALNGFKQIKKYIVANILASIVNLLLTSILVILFNLKGALISIVLGQSIVFIVTLFFISKYMSISLIKVPVEKATIIKLAKFTVMVIVTGVTVPVSELIIRNYIIETISIESAGYWQGMVRLSGVYLAVITTALSTYYLPRLSEIKVQSELRIEIINGYKVIVPLLTFLIVSIYFLREPIILVLFTDEFLAMKELFTFQLIGDFFKISSWLLAYLMWAKAMVRVFIATEIIFTISKLLLSFLFINSYGLVGVTYAHAINYFIYLLIILVIFKNLISNKSD
jgi:PST family polysaccharide transporter